MNIKGTWVEIIDLKLLSPIKCDGLYKKGASWAGTHLLIVVITNLKNVQRIRNRALHILKTF